MLPDAARFLPSRGEILEPRGKVLLYHPRIYDDLSV
jgi:hypothetical protein